MPTFLKTNSIGYEPETDHWTFRWSQFTVQCFAAWEAGSLSTIISSTHESLRHWIAIWLLKHFYWSLWSWCFADDLFGQSNSSGCESLQQLPRTDFDTSEQHWRSIMINSENANLNNERAGGHHSLRNTCLTDAWEISNHHIQNLRFLIQLAHNTDKNCRSSSNRILLHIVPMSSFRIHINRSKKQSLVLSWLSFLCQLRLQ